MFLSTSSSALPTSSKSLCCFAEYTLKDPQNAAHFKNTFTNNILQPTLNNETPNTGMVTWCLTTSLELNKTCIYETKLISNLQSLEKHLSKDQKDSIQNLVEKYCNGVKHSPCTGSLTKGQCVNPYPHTLMGGKWGKKLMAMKGTAFMCEFRCEFDTQVLVDQFLQHFNHLYHFDKTNDFVKVSAFANQGPGWWRNSTNSNAFSSNFTVSVIFILSTALGYRALFNSKFATNLSQFFKQAKHHEFILTAENLQEENLQEFVEFFSDRFVNVTEKRSILAGYLLHPIFTQNWDGNIPEYLIPKKKKKSNVALKKSAPSKPAKFSHLDILNSKVNRKSIEPPNTSQVSVGAPSPPTLPSSSNIASSSSLHESSYKLSRNSKTNTPISIHFESRKIPPKPKTLVVPLIDVLRYCTGVKHMVNQISFARGFSVLERMRSFLRESDFFNSQSFEKNPSRVERFIEKMLDMGFSVFSRQNEKLTVIFDSLQLLVNDIEKEYKQFNDSVDESIKRNDSIDFMGLQQLYKIGSVVCTRSIGNLSGTLVTLRVTDCFYEPSQSLFGTTRYNTFSIRFETILCLGGMYLQLDFSKNIGEWSIPKRIESLNFIPLNPNDSSTMKLRKKRIKIASEIGSNPEFKKYNPGSFFPLFSMSGSSFSSKTSKRKGAVSSNFLQASAGRMITDSVHGLQLGYSPVYHRDSIGQAAGYAMKHLRQFMNETNDFPILREKMKSLRHINVFDSFPEGYEPWPCIIGFSLTLKSWGYVIFDSLERIIPNPLAWNHLILDKTIKESLIALCSEIPEQRYTYNDLIDGKGAGSVYLLYGPPGTGKSLTVESLAEYLGIPLYSISFAELGTSVSQLEERLSETLHLASRWGSIVLLDEGEALVSKRSIGQYHLNSMTGVLLRILENFEGHLFITSNRIQAFDPAALSRVTLLVEYKSLPAQGLSLIWKNMIARVLSSSSDSGNNLSHSDLLQYVETNFDLKLLSSFKCSGRSIGAVLRIGISLCEHRNVSLNQSILNDAIEIFTQS